MYVNSFYSTCWVVISKFRLLPTTLPGPCVEAILGSYAVCIFSILQNFPSIGKCESLTMANSA